MPDRCGVVRIGEWRVDPEVDELSRGEQTIRLEPRTMRLLLYLAAHAGRVVEVQQLLDEVWPNVVVSHSSVYQAIAQLRRVLGDDSEQPSYIENLPRRGYRLIAPVVAADGTSAVAPGGPIPAAVAEPPLTGAAGASAVEVSAVADPAIPAPAAVRAPAEPARRRATLRKIVLGAVLLAGIGMGAAWRTGHLRGLLPVRKSEVAVAAVAPKSIAVLPFVDMSEKHDQGYFSDGLSEELIDMLSRVPGLRVPARTSSFYFKDKQARIADIARELGVTHLLEGSVRKAGDTLRVTAQLVRVDNGYHVWSETYDRKFGDIFRIQDEIAAAVVSALKLTLTGEEKAAGVLGTTNPEAYNAYLLGRHHYAESSESGYREAIEAYQRAIRLDPRYADADAELAMAEYYLGDDTGDLALEKAAEEAAQRAIDIDPQRAGGYTVRAYLRFNIHYDWAGAEADFRQALALDPTDSRALRRYASMLNQIGRTEEAAMLLRKGIEQDPLDASTWTGLADALVASRNYPAAYEAVHRALAVRPGDRSSVFQLGCLQLVDGKAQEALATFESNSFAVFRDTGVAMATHTLGDARASQEALDRLIAAAAGDAAYQIAEVYAWRGERDKAFEWLERAYRQQDGGLTAIKTDVLLVSLRSDPRYGALLRKLKLPA